MGLAILRRRGDMQIVELDYLVVIAEDKRKCNTYCIDVKVCTYYKLYIRMHSTTFSMALMEAQLRHSGRGPPLLIVVRLVW